MNETELERLVVRLTGDGAEYMRMLQQAQQETRETARIVEEQGRTIEGFKSKLQGFASSALGFLGSLGIRNWLHEAQHAYQEQERADIRLRAILEVNGRAVDEQFARYQRFAAEMMDVAAAADEVTIGMLQQAEAMGVTGAAAERAVRNVIAAQAAGIHVGIRQAVMLEQGHLGRLAHQLGDLGGGSESEKVARAQEKLQRMFAVAETTGKNAFKQLGIAWGELMEDFGKAFNELMKPIVEIKKGIIDWFRSLSDGEKQAIIVLAAITSGVLAIAAAITLAGTAFNTMFGGAGLIIGAIVTAGAASAYWLSTFESVQKAWEVIKEKGGQAWEWIKGKAMAFWDWLLPIARATWGVLTAGWELVKEAAVIAWDIIKSVINNTIQPFVALWRRFVGDWSVNWDDMKKKVVLALITIEFGLLNFRRVATLAVDMVRLAYHVWFEEVKHGLREMFSTERTARVISDFERNLVQSIVRQQLALTETFDAFKRQRMGQYFASPEEEMKLEKAGQQQQEAFNKGREKEIEKFEAVARNSAEAVSRIYSYMERVVENRGATGQGAERREMVAVLAPEAQARINEHNRNLIAAVREVRDAIRQEEPQIVVEPAGLA